MSTHNPERLHELAREFTNSGDVDALVGLYEPDATLAPQPGEAVIGTGAIREALRASSALNLKFTKLETAKAFRADDVALLSSEWVLTGVGPDGSEFGMSGRGAQVARRQPDGTWLFVIDDPWASTES